MPGSGQCRKSAQRTPRSSSQIEMVFEVQKLLYLPTPAKPKKIMTPVSFVTSFDFTRKSTYEECLKKLSNELHKDLRPASLSFATLPRTVNHMMIGVKREEVSRCSSDPY